MREQIDEEAEAVRAAAFSAVIDDGRHDIKTFLGNKATMEGGGGGAAAAAAMDAAATAPRFLPKNFFPLLSARRTWAVALGRRGVT